jgi:hypothetical protein
VKQAWSIKNYRYVGDVSRTIDALDQKYLEALLSCGEYFESKNSSLEYQDDADKSSRNLSSGHAEKSTRKTFKARKHEKKPLERQYLQKRARKALRKYPVPKESSLEEIHTSKI